MTVKAAVRALCCAVAVVWPPAGVGLRLWRGLLVVSHSGVLCGAGSPWLIHCNFRRAVRSPAARFLRYRSTASTRNFNLVKSPGENVVVSKIKAATGDTISKFFDTISRASNEIWPSGGGVTRECEGDDSPLPSIQTNDASAPLRLDSCLSLLGRH